MYFSTKNYFLLLLLGLISTVSYAQITSEYSSDRLVFKESTITKAILDYDGTDFTFRNQEFTATGTADIRLESPNGHVDMIAGNELRARFQEEGGLRLYAPNNGSYLMEVQNDGDLKFIGDGGLVAMDINDSNGRVGIGTESATELLDVNGQVRVREFQEILAGTGRQVFVDANGVLSVEFIPTLSQDDEAGLRGDLQQKEEQLQALEERVAELENMISQLAKQQNLSIQKPTFGNFLRQNEPNPNHGQTTIRYQLPQQVAHYQLQITNGNGQVVQLKELDESGAVEINGLFNGTYHYSLLKNGQPLESKTMIVQR
ncbi:MAG: T9SS type A sorting domain-containing protein [Saprospiraceae bacterium]